MRGGIDRAAVLQGIAGERVGATPAKNHESAAERCGSSYRCTSVRKCSNCCFVCSPSTLSYKVDWNVTSSWTTRSEPTAPAGTTFLDTRAEAAFDHERHATERARVIMASMLWRASSCKDSRLLDP